MKRMTDQQKVEALNNALTSFNFPSKYFIYKANKGRDILFTLAHRIDGAVKTHTRFMNYDEMNCFLVGYNFAITKPLD